MKNISRDLTSNEFKNAARKAIYAIVFFIFSYLLLLLLAIAFAVLCGALGIGIITLKVHWLTLVLGAGLVGMGLIVVFFLIKFVFKKHKIDRSHLIELREEDAPILYQDIKDIVTKLGTNFPKRIYISHEVNACVFYDSTFLSMIFPVKKNLQIGMALVNTVSRAELKAILAHEFGHFSQRSMKVGSYVYTVNQIIYNMLYDNEGYGKVIQKFAGVSGYFAFFAAMGIKVIEGIQWVLKKLYNLVNINHLKLSREMEFHADAIAVNIIGSKPFISSMMRLDLSNNAFDRTLGYYEQKISKNIKPTNIYPQHQLVMKTIAQDTGVEFVNGLPNVTKEYINRYNKSKLVINNQWASHPSTEDRIESITGGSYPEGEDNGEPASMMFAAINDLQTDVTKKLFQNVEYSGTISHDNYNIFETEYLHDFSKKSFPALFNGYYDNYNPTKVDLEQSTVSEVNITFDQLYAKDKIDSLYSAFSLEADINILKQIQSDETDIKSFEYDGEKYQRSDTYDLIPKLENELTGIKTSMSINDLVIHEYFKNRAIDNHLLPNYILKYEEFLAFDKAYDNAINLYSKIIEQTSFIQDVTPYDDIERNFVNFAQTEVDFKQEIRSLLRLPIIDNVDLDTKDKLEGYLSKETLIYFAGSSYNDAELDILFNAINAFINTLNIVYFELKMDYLKEMERLQLNSKKILV